MEPLRPRVDRLVLSFVPSYEIVPSDFILSANGVCRLHPQLARQVAGSALSNAVVQEIVGLLAKELQALRNCVRIQ
jgi:hypothetical protein